MDEHGDDYECLFNPGTDWKNPRTCLVCDGTGRDYEDSHPYCLICGGEGWLDSRPI